MTALLELEELVDALTDKVAGELPKVCGWHGGKARCAWEHRRPAPLTTFGRVWVPTCRRCHRWLTGQTGEAGRDGPDDYRPAAAIRPLLPQMVSRETPHEPTPIERAIAGTEAAGRRWCDAERALVDQAIGTVANRLETFTADDVWRELAGRVPVTKGLTGRLMAATRAGVMVNTGETTIADRGGEHDHAQRLTVWRSLHAT
jgi:hypothetical protein